MTPQPRGSFHTGDKADLGHAGDSIGRVIEDWGRTRPDLDVEPIAVTARIARLQAQLGPKLESLFGRFGVRGADFAVIATIVRLDEESVSQRRLAQELGLTAGTISLRVDRLVRRGLAERAPDPADGRGALVTLTERARDLFQACAPQHLANARGLLAGLSDEEREQLGDLLGKLLSSLEDPGPDDRIALDLGMVVEGAPFALERRRAVGLDALPGLLVRHVDPAGPAASSGIRPGDLLRTADGRPLRTHHDLRLAAGHARGGRLALELIRGAEAVSARLALSGRSPSRRRRRPGRTRA
jgi:DNA-binding MarR family transcriptional regulator